MRDEVSPSKGIYGINIYANFQGGHLSKAENKSIRQDFIGFLRSHA
jgi:hypothetical protein